MENKLVFGVIIGMLIALMLFGGKATKYHGTYGIGMGDPCYYPAERQADGSCK